jgi:hypothetical protein
MRPCVAAAIMQRDLACFVKCFKVFVGVNNVLHI